MLNRSTSLISLATIDQNSDPHGDSWEYDAQPLTDETLHHQTETEAGISLCARCQNLDIQSFSRCADRRKGYLLKDVEEAAHQGCQFCTLLLDAVKDVERPEYFYSNAFVGKTTLNPDLYVHLTLSESYKHEAPTTPSGNLRANRFLIELGDRFSGMRNPSTHEICIAADSGRHLFITHF